MSDMRTELNRALVKRRVLTNEERRELALAAFGEATLETTTYVNKMAYTIQRWLEAAEAKGRDAI